MADQLEQPPLHVIREDPGEEYADGNHASKSYSCEDCGERFSCYKDLADHHKVCLSQLSKPSEVSEPSDVDPPVYSNGNDTLLSTETSVGKSDVNGNNNGVETGISPDNENMHSKPQDGLELESSISNSNGTDNAASSPLDVEEIWRPQKKGGKYKCRHCSKSFTRKDAVLNHMKNHTGKKPHQCETCGKTFGFKGNLNVHMRIHTGFKPFICDICGKSFRQKGNLNTHSTIHLRKHFDCNDCSKCFADRKSLENHMKTHSPAPVKKSVDPAKTAVETKPAAMKNSATKKGRNGRQPPTGKTYECMACGQSFGDQVSVVDHMMINHTVENTC